MQQYRKNLGKVSLTAEGVWDIKSKYDVLSIVYDEHTQHGFISKQPVPIGVDLYNSEYWMPLNVSGYTDSNIIILNKKTSDASIETYTLEEAIKSIASVGRKSGCILGFYNSNANRLDIGGRWEIWQFNSTTVSEWEDLSNWQNIYYNYNQFVGWYRNEEQLKINNPYPEVGCYAYVGNVLNEAVVYRCEIKHKWTETIQRAWDYVKIMIDGTVTVGENGNWYNNGEDTGIPANIKGDPGLSPYIIYNTSSNKLEYSYDKVKWIECSDYISTWFRLNNNKLEISRDNAKWNPVSDYIAAWFRWQATAGDTQANNAGRIQISRDNGKTWTNMSNDFTNNLHISRYIGVTESLPTSGIAEGTIYAKGPYYAAGDTLNDNPIYRLWVYAWKGDTLAWQDNGEFTSIAAGVVQETGDSETEVMSQKEVSTNIYQLGSLLNNYSLSSPIKRIDGVYIKADGAFNNDARYTSSLLPISKKNNISIENHSTDTCSVSFFDRDSNFISLVYYFQQYEKYVIESNEIPLNAFYVCVSYKTELEDYININNSSLLNQSLLIKCLDDSINNITEKESISGKYINNNGGLTQIASAYKVSYLYDASVINNIYYKTHAAIDSYIIAAYDSNMNLLTEYSVYGDSWNSEFEGFWQKADIVKYIRFGFSTQYESVILCSSFILKDIISNKKDIKNNQNNLRELSSISSLKRANKGFNYTEGRYLNIDGTIQNSGSYAYSFFDITDSLYFQIYNLSNETIIVNFYDNNNNFISNIKGWYKYNIYITKENYPLNAKYVSISGTISSLNSVLFTASSLNKLPSTIEDNIDPKKIIIEETNQGYQDNNGVFSNNSSYRLYKLRYNNQGFVIKSAKLHGTFNTIIIQYCDVNDNILYSAGWVSCNYHKTDNEIKNLLGDKYKDLSHLNVGIHTEQLANDIYVYTTSLYCSLVQKSDFIEESEIYDQYIKDLDKINYDSDVDIDISKSFELITINNQNEFDNINNVINECISNKTSAIIELKEGIYSFTEHNIININNIIQDEVSIIIRNANKENVIITGSDEVFNKTNATAYTSSHWIASCNSYNWKTSNLINIDSESFIICNSQNKYGVTYSNGLIEVVDANATLCRLPLPAEMAITYTEEECVNSFIWFDTWFRGNLAQIKYIQDGYVYFVFEGLGAGYGNKEDDIRYNVNNSYYFGNKYPRFNIFNLPFCITADTVLAYGNNIYVPLDIYDLYNCNKTTFIKYINSKLKNISIEGIKFIGNSWYSEVGKDDFHHHLDVEAINSYCLFEAENAYNLSVRKCKFKLLGGRGILYDKLCHNTHFEYNTIEDIQSSGIISSSQNLSAKNNKFKNIGIITPNNVFAIRAIGTQVSIKNNTITDFSGGISVGGYRDWHEDADIIVESNELSYSNEFNSNYEKYTLMDTGAIYLSPKNKMIIVRDNKVKNIIGMHNNHGIFCDDGCANVKVYKNFVSRIISGDSINLREVVFYNNHNTGNLIAYNILDCKYTFVGSNENDNSYCFKNICLGKYILNPPYIKNISYLQDDYIDYDGDIIGDNVLTSLGFSNPQMFGKIVRSSLKIRNV